MITDVYILNPGMDEPELLGQRASLYEAMLLAAEALVYNPYSVIDGHEDGEYAWTAVRDKVTDDYVTVFGQVNGRVDISEHLGS